MFTKTLNGSDVARDAIMGALIASSRTLMFEVRLNETVRIFLSVNDMRLSENCYMSRKKKKQHPTMIHFGR